MTKIKLIILCLSFITLLNSQQLVVNRSFGNFENAYCLTRNTFGSFFILDIETNSIVKIDTTGLVLKSIGGYGWDESTFDNPTDIVSNGLSIYVADKNNHRIQIFDRDLNFVTSLQSNEENNLNFRYPTALDVSNMGDIFVIDSENARVLKFDPSGSLSAVIGDYDAGSFILEQPIDIKVIGNDKIYVLDGTKIVEYDIYGNGLNSYEFDFESFKIEIANDFLFLLSKDQIHSVSLVNMNLKDTIYVELGEEVNSEFMDIAGFNNIIYLLTSKTIYSLSLISPE